MIRAYTARAMTGENWRSIYQQAHADAITLASCGIQSLDPVIEEVKSLGGVVPDGVVGQGKFGDPELLAEHWKRDKRMIRAAHVLIDLSPLHKSEGVAHEIGLARYGYWMPVVRVFPPGQLPRYSVAYFDDDVLTDDLTMAANIINERWGTWPKRFAWRLGMYLRSAPKHYWFKLRRWFL